MLFFDCCDRDAVRLGVLDGRLAARQCPPRVAPRREDRQVRRQRHVGQLEPDLVVALAGGAVGDGVGAVRPRHLDLVLGDERPRDARAQQVLALVHRPGLEHRPEVIGDELLAQVLDEDLAGAAPAGLLDDAVEFAGALPQVGHERHDLAAVRLPQPRQDDRGIQAARVRQDRLFHATGCCHIRFHLSLVLLPEPRA